MERAVEAVLLGLSVGLVCVASCGAVLIPWLVVQQRGVVATAWLLGQVLAGRLAGYLLFAALAWTAGAVLVPAEGPTRVAVFGAVYVALAAMLLLYALAGMLRRRAPNASLPQQIPANALRRWIVRLGPPALGFLTGVNLCPPFVAASVRAAESQSLFASLAFFTLFFLGTTVWFVPFLATGAARRFPDARPIARVAMCLVAAYYGYVGIVAIGWRVLHG